MLIKRLDYFFFVYFIWVSNLNKVGSFKITKMKKYFFIFLICCMQIANGLYVDEPLLYGTFPAGFKWAAATSAYQIEGGWDADGNIT